MRTGDEEASEAGCPERAPTLTTTLSLFGSRLTFILPSPCFGAASTTFAWSHAHRANLKPVPDAVEEAGEGEKDEGRSSESPRAAVEAEREDRAAARAAAAAVGAAVEEEAFGGGRMSVCLSEEEADRTKEKGEKGEK